MVTRQRLQWERGPLMKIKLPFGIGNLRYINWFAFAAMAVLMIVGVCYVYSANAFRESPKLQSLYIAQAHLAILCMAIGFVMPLFDYNKILKFSWFYYLGTIALLVAVLLLGTSQGMGAKRWVFGIQPSEFAKLATIMLIAKILGRRDASRDLWDFAFVALVAIFPVALIFMQPDLGTSIIFAPLTAVLLFASGTAPKTLLSLVLAGVLSITVVLGSIALEASPKTPEPVRKACSVATSFLGNYQKGRLLDFVFPDRDPLGGGWNRRQSQIAVGSGGLWGKGFLKGDQNILGYLPQQVSANDFIFSVFAEEKGFVGAVSLLVCYGILLLSVLATGVAAPDVSGRLLCVGVATLVFCHVFVNIGMTVGMLPVTGLPLPFVSYGRTFMATLGLAMGLVQCVAVRARTQRKVQDKNGL